MPQINFRYILNELKAKASVLSGTGAPASSPIYAVANAPAGKTLYEQTDTDPRKLWFKSGSGTWLEVGSGGGGGGGSLIPWDMTPAPAPVVSCAYPMDGSNAEVLARMAYYLGVTEKATTSGQTVSHVLDGSTCNLGAINSLETTFDPTAVGKAFEVELTIPTLETTSEAEIYLYVYSKSSDVDSFIRKAIAAKGSGGDFEFVIDSVAHALTTGDRVGFYLDPTPDTGGWRYYLNGVDVGGVSSGPVSYTDLCIGFRVEVTATSAPDIGDAIAAELISAASDMTGTYPSGTTDICGNPLAGDAALPSGAVAGSLLEVEVAGTYAAIPYSVGDVAVVLTDGTTVQKLAPEDEPSGILSLTGVDGIVIDSSDPQNPVISSTSVLKASTALIAYGTNSYGNEQANYKSHVTQSVSTFPSKNVITINCENALDKTTKVFLNDNATSWNFTGRPPTGMYYELDVYIVQGSTPKTCPSPATAGLTAGGAWTVSGVANSVQRLTLKVTDTSVELYPYPVLS